MQSASWWRNDICVTIAPQLSHKCENAKNPQNSNIQVRDFTGEGTPEDLFYVYELMDSIMHCGTDDSQASIKTMAVSCMKTSIASSYHEKVTSLPSDSTEVLYTPVVLNNKPVWPPVYCGATTLFVATQFVAKHGLPMSVA